MIVKDFFSSKATKFYIFLLTRFPSTVEFQSLFTVTPMISVGKGPSMVQRELYHETVVTGKEGSPMGKEVAEVGGDGRAAAAAGKPPASGFSNR